MGTEFIWGLVSGAGATGITALIARYWPLLVNVISREANIGGHWIWFDSTNTGPVGNMQIVQAGSKVRGQFERNISIDGETTKRVFRFEGLLYGQIIVLNYEEPDDPKSVRGTMILKLVSGRMTFYGKTMYFESHKNEISTYNFILSRKDDLSLDTANYLGVSIPELNSESKNAL